MDEGDGAEGGELFEQVEDEVAAEALATPGGVDGAVEEGGCGGGVELVAAAGEDLAFVFEDVEVFGDVEGRVDCKAGGVV